MKRMLIIERLGEMLYETLRLRSRDAGQLAIYECLRDNERQTAAIIRSKMTAGISSDTVTDRLLFKVSRFLLRVVPVALVLRALKAILRRQIYSVWHDRFGHEDPQFWHALREHERLQHKLLGLDPGRKKRTSWPR